MRIVNALDILLFWIVFDYINLMAFLVVLDLFVVLFPFVERYVQLDKTDESQLGEYKWQRKGSTIRQR